VSPGLFKKFRQPSKPAFRIFFATDVHGSDRCFRKFLAAASVYEADALILGGDVAGKAMVPIVEHAGARFSYSFQGATATVDATELEEVKRQMGFNGFYPRVTEAADVERMSEDPGYVEQLFDEAIADQVAGWCELAAERLPDSVRCVITPGNDDPAVIDGVLERAPKIECPELETVELGPVWLSSCGNTNRTPWDTDREYDEPELARQIDAMVAPFADGRPLVFNFHCPPYDTGLDTAPKLDEDFRPVLDRGSPVEIPVGSTAVREAIERYQPVAGIHGHIHESANARQLGRSWCLNPGSDYSSGALKGLILDLEDDGAVRSHLFTHG
jgi:Icc-related predicted phosphoesterase